MTSPPECYSVSTILIWYQENFAYLAFVYATDDDEIIPEEEVSPFVTVVLLPTATEEEAEGTGIEGVSETGKVMLESISAIIQYYNTICTTYLKLADDGTPLDPTPLPVPEEGEVPGDEADDDPGVSGL